jgi:D-3-phosphoglycerate dehydrogenase
MISALALLQDIEAYRPRFAERGVRVLTTDVRDHLSEADLLRLGSSFDGVICGDDEFTARVIAENKRLRSICKWGVGLDSIDVDACQASGVSVHNTPGAFAEPVADTAIGYALIFVRRLVELDNAIRSAGWKKLEARSVGEVTFGVVGMGSIGSAVRRRAAAFGAEVLGTDPRPTAGDGSWKSLPLGEILARSDIVVIACDLNPSSQGLIGYRELMMMRPGCAIINLSRGSVLDEAGLLRALSGGHLGFVALDVFWDEPLSADHPIRSYPSVFLASHNANSSERCRRAVHDATITQVISDVTDQRQRSA